MVTGKGGNSPGAGTTFFKTNLTNDYTFRSYLSRWESFNFSLSELMFAQKRHYGCWNGRGVGWVGGWRRVLDSLRREIPLLFLTLVNGEGWWWGRRWWWGRGVASTFARRRSGYMLESPLNIHWIHIEYRFNTHLIPVEKPLNLCWLSTESLMNIHWIPTKSPMIPH